MRQYLIKSNKKNKLRKSNSKNNQFISCRPVGFRRELVHHTLNHDLPNTNPKQKQNLYLQTDNKITSPQQELISQPAQTTLQYQEIRITNDFS